MPASPPLSLLRALIACGERLQAALEAGALDEARRLAEERGRIVEAIGALPRSDVSSAPTGAELARAFEDQHRTLMALLADRERELADALARAAHHRHAEASYNAPPPPSGRLSRLHG